MIAGQSLPHGPKRAADGIELAFVLIFALFASVAAAAMLLAWLGRFRPTALALLAVPAGAAALVGVMRSWRRESAGRRRATPADLGAAVAVAALSAGLFFHPAKYAADGNDGSIYAATAVLLEQQGSLRPIDPMAAALTPGERALMFTTAGLPQRFPGGMYVDLDTGRLRPGFLHLYPALMAAAGLAFGPAAKWLVNPVLAMGGVLALWLIGRRLSGSLAGATAAALLAVTMVQIWFARFPSSEMTAQFLTLSGLALAAIAADTRWVPAAAAAGAAFGLLAFTRMDVLLLVTPVVALWIVLEVRRNGATGHVAWMAAVFAGFTLSGVVYAGTVAGGYAWRVISTLVAYADRHSLRVVLAAAAAAFLMAGLIARRGARRPSVRLTVAVGVVTVILAGWLLWRDATKGHFVDVISPVGAAAGVGGLLVAVAGSSRERALLAGLLFLSSLGYLGSPMDRALLPWVLRRYIPVLLPIACLGVGVLTQTLADRWRRWPAALLLPALLGAWLAWRAWPVAAHPVMQAGSVELNRIVAGVPAPALLLWDAATPPHLALGVQYHQGTESVVVPADNRAIAPVRKIVTQALTSARPAYLVVDPHHLQPGGASWRARLAGFRLTPERTVSYRTELAGTSDRRLILHPYQIERRLDFYAIGQESSASPVPLPLLVEIGDRDVPYVLDGFYSGERHGSAAVRWTGAVARLVMPALDVPDGRVPKLSMRLASWRPAGVSAALELSWNGQLAGRATLASDWAEYGFTVPVDALRRGGELILRCATFVPRAAGMGDDARSLGVLIDWLRIE